MFRNRTFHYKLDFGESDILKNIITTRPRKCKITGLQPPTLTSPLKIHEEKLKQK